MAASSISDVLDVLFTGQVVRQPYSEILEVMDLFQSGTLQKNERTMTAMATSNKHQLLFGHIKAEVVRFCPVGPQGRHLLESQKSPFDWRLVYRGQCRQRTSECLYQRRK